LLLKPFATHQHRHALATASLRLIKHVVTLQMDAATHCALHYPVGTHPRACRYTRTRRGVCSSASLRQHHTSSRPAYYCFIAVVATTFSRRENRLPSILVPSRLFALRPERPFFLWSPHDWTVRLRYREEGHVMEKAPRYALFTTLCPPGGLEQPRDFACCAESGKKGPSRRSMVL
jgi:hypothetical protein